MYGTECVVEAKKAAFAMKDIPYRAVVSLPSPAEAVVAVPGTLPDYQPHSNPKHFFTKHGQKEMASSTLVFCCNLKEESGKLEGRASFAAEAKHGAKIFKKSTR